MHGLSLKAKLDGVAAGKEIFALAASLYPICRSVAGEGVRETLRLLGRHIPLAIREVPSGTRVFDWSVPLEWEIRDAFIKNSAGERIVDFQSSNLHVVNYSTPVHARMRLADLKEHVFTLPCQPDLVPYRTSYYAESWGFCMSHNQLMALPEGIYEVMIDSGFKKGSMSYGELLHKGETEEEILLSAHICHPSLANDNCSGLALLTYLASQLAHTKTRFSYRFLFAPGTIGAITWLAQNERNVSRIKNGLVVSCVGDGGGPTYKRSRGGNALIDRAMTHVLRHASSSPNIIDFFPYGYDERQYCSPGFDLPVGLFQRSQFATFPEYHTSADNLDFIKPDHFASSYSMITSALDIVENDVTMRNRFPKGEPQLGRRGLYSLIGGSTEGPAKSMALLWVLNLSDGKHSLLDIAERANMPFGIISDAARLLQSEDLLERVEGAAAPPPLSKGRRTVVRPRTVSIGDYH
jgi:aminopeptidase-like protein